MTKVIYYYIISNYFNQALFINNKDTLVKENGMNWTIIVLIGLINTIAWWQMVYYNRKITKMNEMPMIIFAALTSSSSLIFFIIGLFKSHNKHLYLSSMFCITSIILLLIPFVVEKISKKEVKKVYKKPNFRQVKLGKLIPFTRD